jgi:plasmid stabilization system protein ParE
MIVRVLAAAKDDLRSAGRFLEERRLGLGIRLYAEYGAVLERLERFPQMNPLVDDELPGREVRNAILERLKYRIVYEVREAEILVVAVLHTRRRDNLWHTRLLEE